MSQLIRWHGPCPGFPESNPTDKEHIAQLEAQLRQVIHEVQVQRVQHERWKESLTLRLHEEADNRGYCSEFDDVMEELGLARRTRPHKVTVSVTVELVCNVDARDVDHAEELAAEWLVVGDGDSVRVEGHRGTITDVEMQAEEQ